MLAPSGALYLLNRNNPCTISYATGLAHATLAHSLKNKQSMWTLTGILEIKQPLDFLLRGRERGLTKYFSYRIFGICKLVFKYHFFTCMFCHIYCRDERRPLDGWFQCGRACDPFFLWRPFFHTPDTKYSN